MLSDESERHLFSSYLFFFYGKTAPDFRGCFVLRIKNKPEHEAPAYFRLLITPANRSDDTTDQHKYYITYLAVIATFFC